MSTRSARASTGSTEAPRRRPPGDRARSAGHAGRVTNYDVVLFGPTGVTGREVARHLARRAPELGLTWAVAGRDRARIDAVLDGLPSRPTAVVHADTGDEASIDAMAASATVVANLVGPYARHGEVVYEACARHGTDELDLTGEVDWVERMIGRHHEAAVASGARILPTAGFEALPFDLGCSLAAETAHGRSGSPIVAVDVAVTTTSDVAIRRPADAVSGGTYVSGVEALRRGPDRAFTDPYLLDPPSGAGRGAAAPTGRYDLRPRRHTGTGAWLAPMVPSPFLNPPVVHRGAALRRAAGDATFAPSFRYREGMATGGSVPAAFAPAAAAALSAFQTGFGLLAAAPAAVRRPLADALLRFGPAPGDGPRRGRPRPLVVPPRRASHRRGRDVGRRGRGRRRPPRLQVNGDDGGRGSPAPGRRVGGTAVNRRVHHPRHRPRHRSARTLRPRRRHLHCRRLTPIGASVVA